MGTPVCQVVIENEDFTSVLSGTVVWLPSGCRLVSPLLGNNYM
ncbi:hypothetical protein LMG9449_1678 [Lactococcus lactis subsp. lactis]|uniref:Uncharacterized protein n=1 Tax=Lactococcus lactis subsp. lactis TaxID=1360 RepID=A0A0V8DVJ9_LACLL|nr:hypothetical protein [Lactococcus lactis]KSU17423.1 hypothetical protein LMG9449_1678 [Lactococcus lactis subsp. lactis]